MKLSGLHLLLTCQCTFECDHCFVWGSPWQSGVMTHNLPMRAVCVMIPAGACECSLAKA